MKWVVNVAWNNRYLDTIEVEAETEEKAQAQAWEQIQEGIAWSVNPA